MNLEKNPIYQNIPQDEAPKHIISKLCMIFGSLSLCIFPPLSLPAIVLGFISIFKEPEAKYLRIVGFITSAISIILTILFIIGVRALLSKLGFHLSDFRSIESIRSLDWDPVFEHIYNFFH